MFSQVSGLNAARVLVFPVVGHDALHHVAIAEGKPVVRSLIKYHGKEGSGASVEFKLKEGSITMLGITQYANGKFRFIIGEGESQAGPIPIKIQLLLKSKGWSSAKLPPIPNLSIISIAIQVFMSNSPHIGKPLPIS